MTSSSPFLITTILPVCIQPPPPGFVIGILSVIPPVFLGIETWLGSSPQAPGHTMLVVSFVALTAAFLFWFVYFPNPILKFLSNRPSLLLLGIASSVVGLSAAGSVYGQTGDSTILLVPAIIVVAVSYGFGHTPAKIHVVKYEETEKFGGFGLIMLLLGLSSATLISLCDSRDLLQNVWMAQDRTSLLLMTLFTTWIMFVWWPIYFGFVRPVTGTPTAAQKLSAKTFLIIGIGLDVASFIGASILLGMTRPSTTTHDLLVAFIVIRGVAYTFGHSGVKGMSHARDQDSGRRGPQGKLLLSDE
ncbi:MAG: hypothetical protein ACPGR8_10460 [Limisphaerales bacterium]